MPTLSPDTEFSFSTTLPIQVLIRPLNQAGADWQDLDRGPGYFKIPAGHEASIRIRTIDTPTMDVLIKEIGGCLAITALNLSENRNITDHAMEYVAGMRQLTELNLSSCAITDSGLEPLRMLSALARLNLSYCNRITDVGLRSIQGLRNLTYLDLQGCVKISNGGVSKLRRRTLTIHK